MGSREFLKKKKKVVSVAYLKRIKSLGKSINLQPTGERDSSMSTEEKKKMMNGEPSYRRNDLVIDPIESMRWRGTNAKCVRNDGKWLGVFFNSQIC